MQQRLGRRTSHFCSITSSDPPSTNFSVHNSGDICLLIAGLYVTASYKFFSKAEMTVNMLLRADSQTSPENQDLGSGCSSNMPLQRFSHERILTQVDQNILITFCM